MTMQAIGRVAVLIGLGLSIACGGSNKTGAILDGGLDGTVGDSAPADVHTTPDGMTGGDALGSDSAAEAGADANHPGCFSLGAGCAAAGDCCSGVCTTGVCSYPACTSDNLACTAGASCCSGTCTGGTCTPLPPSGCGKTLGNACTLDSQCCSGLCAGSVCAVSSFCGQNGDVCLLPTDCCGGVCTIANGQAKGTCSQPPAGAANCSMVDGTLCGGVGADGGLGLADGGLPSCGGSCCSRLCAPYGPTGVFVCQPASGCHVVGDLCAQDSDCCGSTGMPTIPTGGPVTCNITPPNVVGTCGNPTGCKPNGDICKLPTSSCSDSCDCCAGTAGGGTSKCDTDCRQDNLGVPRCTGPTCVNAGASCASSADCCNNVPCVPNPAFVDGGSGPPFVCSNVSCVAACGGCTTNADCCPGETCDIAQGRADGVCGPCVPATDGGTGGDGGTMGDGGVAKDGGTTGDGGTGTDSGSPACSVYGQQCTSNASCCNGVPCSYNNATCPAGQAGCTCYYVIQ